MEDEAIIVEAVRGRGAASTAVYFCVCFLLVVCDVRRATCDVRRAMGWNLELH
jgi:hypothetical protein